LRFVEDHKGIVECAASHEGDRRNFDGAPFQVAIYLFDVQHLVEGIVEGTQVGVHLLLQAARQEAQALAGLHGRSSQDDPVDLASQQGSHGHGYRQVGLAGTGRADTENHVKLFDGLEVEMLVEAAGSDLFSARKAHPRNENTVLQANLGVFRNDLQDGLEVSVVELKPLFPDLIEVPYRPFDDFNVSCFPFDDQGFGRQG